MNVSNIYSSESARSHFGSAHYTYNDGAQHYSGTGQVFHNHNHRGRTRERSGSVDKELLGAARDGSKKRVEWLLDKFEARAWYRDADGMTALHNACTSDPGIVGKLKLLLDDGGADIDALNNAGESPLRLAINHQGAYSATAKYLIDCGGKDLGPPPHQTSPVGQASRSLSPYRTGSQSPPLRLSADWARPPAFKFLSEWEQIRQQEIDEGEMFSGKRRLDDELMTTIRKPREDREGRRPWDCIDCETK